MCSCTKDAGLPERIVKLIHDNLGHYNAKFMHANRIIVCYSVVDHDGVHTEHISYSADER